MPIIRPKSPHEIQSQVAAFAEAKVHNGKDNSYIINNLGGLAVGDVQDLARLTTEVEHRAEFRADDNQYGRVVKDTEVKVAQGSDYTKFLREVGGRSCDSIAVRKEVLDNFETFRGTVTELIEELDEYTDRSLHPRHLGNGSNADVFVISKDRRDYAVRVPTGEKVNPSSINSHIDAAVLGKQVSHLEQIVAASYEVGVTVAEIMPGREMEKMTPEDVDSITDGQLGQLVDTVLEANRRGIAIDPKPSNVFYSQTEGFGIIDYMSSFGAAAIHNKKQTPHDVVTWLFVDLANMRLTDEFTRSDMTETAYLKKGVIMRKNGEVMRRLKEVATAKLAERDLLGDAVEKFDSRIRENDKTVEDYSSTEYIASMIEARAKSLQTPSPLDIF
jgi:hypothetical protein